MKAVAGSLVVLLLSGCSSSHTREPAAAITDTGTRIAVSEESIVRGKDDFSLSMCIGVWRGVGDSRDVVAVIEPHRLRLVRGESRTEYLIPVGKGPVAEQAGKEFRLSVVRKFDEMGLIIGGEIFLLKLVSEEIPEETENWANQRPDGTSAKAPPSNPSQGAAVPHP